MTAELWQQLGHDDRLDIEKDASEDDIRLQALVDGNVIKRLEDKQPTKVIYVPGRLVSVVV